MNHLFRPFLFSTLTLALPALLSAAPLQAAPEDESAMFPPIVEVMGPEQELFSAIPVESDLRDAVRQVPDFQSCLRRLRSRNPQVQKEAVADLSNRPGKLRAVPYLGALFLQADADREVRKAAAMALGRTGDWAALEYLKKGLDDADRGMRFTTALALGRLRNDGAVSQLEKRSLADADWWTRYAAAVALGQTRNPAAVPALKRALSDGEWQVRQQAARSLGEFRSQPAREALALALKDADPAVRYAAARALGDVGDLDSIEYLRTASSEETEETAKSSMSAAIRKLVSS
ncbi:MAG: HEAT repeat domain-containing protein [Elusimicrobiota bacterium]|jgi:hypothetical protein